MWKTLVLALAACGGTAAAPRGGVLANATPHAAGTGALFNLEVGALGPITGQTPANEKALQELLGARYTVKPIDSMGIELHVFLGEELLFYVIPNDNGTLFNVHVVSSKVAISDHLEWVIGSPFDHDELLTHCECWGTHPVCFRTGDHVAVAFEISCDNLNTPAERHALRGVRIQRAVWSPRPFGGPSSDDSTQPLTTSPPSLKKLFEPTP